MSVHLSKLEQELLCKVVQEDGTNVLLEAQELQEQLHSGDQEAHAGCEGHGTCAQQEVACSDRQHLRYLTNVQKLEQQLATSSWQDAAVALALCREYNSAAMRVLDSDGHNLALQLLEKAQVLCEPGGLLSSSSPRQQRALHAATLNNLAVYHRHRAQPTQALSVSVGPVLQLLLHLTANQDYVLETCS